MPVLGQGVYPPSGAIASELTAVTRRAYMPTLVVQIYTSNPLVSSLLENSAVAGGGISPISIPVQGNSMVQPQWIGYDGSFTQPGNIPGIVPAEFDLKGLVVGIPFLGMEGLVQVDYAIVPLIEARMNDATSVISSTLSNSLYLNTADTQQVIGLPAAIDDGTQAVTYGGLNRNLQPFWRSTVVNNVVPVVPTRALILQYVNQVTKQVGEKPKMGVCGFGTWTALAQDFTALERYNVTSSGSYSDPDGRVQALFTAIDVAGVPIYADANCPEGTLYLLNTDYLGLHIHERASFHFTGFESTLANGQFGYFGAVLTLMELVNSKPRAHGKFTNLQYVNI